VAKAASVDLTTLLNPVATAPQKAAALAAAQMAGLLADQSFDELVDIVFQVVMDNLNVDLLLPKGTISDRFIPEMRKDEPLPKGKLVVLTGAIIFTCKVKEQVLGDEGVAGGKIIDSEIEIEGDDVGKAGVETQTDP
jgi:hypothetical protein